MPSEPKVLIPTHPVRVAAGAVNQALAVNRSNAQHIKCGFRRRWRGENDAGRHQRTLRRGFPRDGGRAKKTCFLLAILGTIRYFGGMSWCLPRADGRFVGRGRGGGKPSGRSWPRRLTPFPRVDGKVFLTRTISKLKQRERDARVVTSPDAASPYGGSRGGLLRALAICALLIGSAALLCMEIASGGSRSLIGMFTLFPLLVAMRVFSPRKAMACGALWGASLFVFLSGGADPLVAVTVSSFALLAAVPALYALVLVWLARRYGFNPLMLAFGWGFVELALIPLGLPGGLLGSTVAFESGSVLSLLQGVLGYVCIAAFIVAVNGLALALLGRAYQRVCGTARVVRGSSCIQQRFFPLEVPITLLFVANLGRPRAPPV